MDQDNEQTTCLYKLDKRSHDPVLDVVENTGAQPSDLEANAIDPNDEAPPGAGASSPSGDSDFDAVGSNDPSCHPPAGPSSSPGPPTPEPNNMEDCRPNLPPRDDDPNPHYPDHAGHADPGQPKLPPEDPMSRTLTANSNAIDLDLWAFFSNSIDGLNALLAQLDAPRPIESELQDTMSFAPMEPPIAWTQLIRHPFAAAATSGQKPLRSTPRLMTPLFSESKIGSCSSAGSSGRHGENAKRSPAHVPRMARPCARG
ncbi:hypothetical protein ColTof3_11779 [Colletotrichum tofieldiae]|nr:hypothetical protein ColTof3_11779 [Colletotrichum tofieldiae]